MEYNIAEWYDFKYASTCSDVIWYAEGQLNTICVGDGNQEDCPIFSILLLQWNHVNYLLAL